jgi:hypothetical protein
MKQRTPIYDFTVRQFLSWLLENSERPLPYSVADLLDMWNAYTKDSVNNFSYDTPISEVTVLTFIGTIFRNSNYIADVIRAWARFVELYNIRNADDEEAVANIVEYYSNEVEGSINRLLSTCEVQINDLKKVVGTLGRSVNKLEKS